MNKIRIITALKNMIFFIEVALAVFLALSLLMGLFSAGKNLLPLLSTGGSDFYGIFKEVLGNIFLLIVGVELIRMLVTHTMRSTLELLVFVIARKMLIYTDTMLDIILGTVAMGIVFAIIKFLIPTKFDRTSAIDLFPGSIKVEELNRISAYNIPAGEGMTIETLIKSLSMERNLIEGSTVDAGPVKLKVSNMNGDRITHVQILESDFS